jgi:hypothetical protein
MPLPSSGTISLSQVNTELGRSSSVTISLGETAVRNLAGVPSGVISMSNLHGKSAVDVTPNPVNWLDAFAQDYNPETEAQITGISQPINLSYGVGIDAQFNCADSYLGVYIGTPAYGNYNTVWSKTGGHTGLISSVPNNGWVKFTLDITPLNWSNNSSITVSVNVYNNSDANANLDFFTLQMGLYGTGGNQ